METEDCGLLVNNNWASSGFLGLPPPVLHKCSFLKVDKVFCFERLLEVLILNELAQEVGLRSDACLQEF